MDFSHANRQIEQLRQDSLTFLHGSIDAATGDYQVEVETGQEMLASPDACMASG